jgi:hypothetical protein
VAGSSFTWSQTTIDLRLSCAGPQLMLVQPSADTTLPSRAACLSAPASVAWHHCQTSFDAAPQDSFWDRIQRVRNKELSILWRTFIIDSTNVFLLNAIPTVVSVSTFTAYILLGNNLTAAKVRASAWHPALTVG